MPSGTVKESRFDAWDFEVPVVLTNDDACGFLQTLDLDSDGGIDHWAVAAPAGESGGLIECESVFTLTGEMDVTCKDACSVDPNCAAAVFTEHNDASGEGVCHFTRHTTLDSSFGRLCSTPGVCGTSITTNPHNSIAFTKCEANNP